MKAFIPALLRSVGSVRSARSVRSAALFAALALLAAPAVSRAQQSAGSYIVVDSASGHIFERSHENQKVQIGSLTKVATAMVVLDWADMQKRDLSEPAVVPPAAVAVAAQGNNPMGLQPGDTATLRDLMYAALLQSDNVAAVTLAWHVGKTLPAAEGDVPPVDRFVAQMNALARKLGMTRTLFLNPHGLDSAEPKLPYSTAADLARLSRYAMDRAAFRFFVSQKERNININHIAGGLAGFSLVNTNELLGYNGVDGVKTGRTRRAGDCVIISAAKAPESIKQGENFIITPRRLLVVVLGAEQRFPAATALLESGWRLHAAWEAAGRPTKKGQNL